MKIRDVLLISKVTLFELAEARRRDPCLVRMLRDRDPAVAAIESSHLETVYAREVVRNVLGGEGIRVHEARRMGRIPNGRYDLVVAVGGDGTVLDIARYVDATPILAVNSSPSSSYGYFSCATADTLEPLLDRILSGDLAPVELTRISLEVDGRRHPHAALNDVLFCNAAPAATSRYVLAIGDDEEIQKSSGVWVATAAGSTGAIRSAGGVVVDMREHWLQYWVREPFMGASAHRYRLLTGHLGPDGIRFRSQMIQGMVFLDGRRNGIPVGYGCDVALRPDAPPLRLFLHNGRGRMGTA
ncbi:MAG TPA: NAD(+)/NADH kinase [Myxococcota bacterium]|jgi:NAD+ kinase|nr:NAD(+)/NADH kinase [Myxococcota bacterium]